MALLLRIKNNILILLCILAMVTFFIVGMSLFTLITVWTLSSPEKFLNSIKCYNGNIINIYQDQGTWDASISGYEYQVMTVNGVELIPKTVFFPLNGTWETGLDFQTEVFSNRDGSLIGISASQEALNNSLPDFSAGESWNNYLISKSIVVICESVKSKTLCITRSQDSRQFSTMLARLILSHPEGSEHYQRRNFAKRIKRVCLNDNNFTPGQLMRLSELKNLQELYCGLNAENLTYIPELSTLIRLDLSDNHITDTTLAHLAKYRNLKELHLDRTQITDDGLSYLGALNILERLGLEGTKVTNRGLTSLHKLKDLRRLNVRLTSVGNAGVEELRRVNQNVDIRWQKF